MRRTPKKHHHDDSGLGCAMTLVAIVFAMPIFGMYLRSRKNATDEDKAVGTVLAVVGLLLWFVVLMKM